jgi:hypothetical protein
LRGDAEGVEGRLGRGGGPEEEDGNEEEVPHGLAARGGEADRRWLASGLFFSGRAPPSPRGTGTRTEYIFTANLCTCMFYVFVYMN